MTSPESAAPVDALPTVYVLRDGENSAQMRVYDRQEPAEGATPMFETASYSDLGRWCKAQGVHVAFAECVTAVIDSTNQESNTMATTTRTTTPKPRKASKGTKAPKQNVYGERGYKLRTEDGLAYSAIITKLGADVIVQEMRRQIMAYAKAHNLPLDIKFKSADAAANSGIAGATKSSTAKPSKPTAHDDIKVATKGLAKLLTPKKASKPSSAKPVAKKASKSTTKAPAKRTAKRDVQPIPKARANARTAAASSAE